MLKGSNLMRKLGYLTAAIAGVGIAHSGQDLLLLPRVRVSRGQSTAKFVASLGY